MTKSRTAAAAKAAHKGSGGGKGGAQAPSEAMARGGGLSSSSGGTSPIQTIERFLGGFEPAASADSSPAAEPELAAASVAPEPAAAADEHVPLAAVAAPEPVANAAAPGPVPKAAAPEQVANERAPEPAATAAAPEPAAKAAAPKPDAKAAAPEPEFQADASRQVPKAAAIEFKLPPAVAGQALPAKVPLEPGLPMIRKAAALREKYRIGCAVRIPVEQVGFHPKNRDGQPPNGSRCNELFKQILAVGFDAEDADSGGIVVEAVPGVHEFNLEACTGDPYHAPAAAAGKIAYGSLSHSHLHQILKNIRGGGPCDTVSVATGGRHCLTKLRTMDPAFARAVDTGLLWEVLSSAIEVEEPGGSAIIQAAMNAKNNMSMVRHEMQAVAALVTYTNTSALAELALSFDAARSALNATCPEFAADPDFLAMYRFVLDLGAGVASFLPDLRAFHGKFVDPKLRRVRLSDFAAVNLWPDNMPHMKVAGVKAAYACDPKALRGGFCEALSSKSVREVMGNDEAADIAAQAEKLLAFFHISCLPTSVAVVSDAVVSARLKADRIKFLGSIDKDVYRLVAAPTSVFSDFVGRRVAVINICAEEYVRMLALFPGVSMPNFPEELPGIALPTALSGAAEAAEGKPLAPKVLQFDKTGTPLNHQDSIIRGPMVEQFAWHTFMSSEEATKPLCEELARSTIMQAIGALARWAGGDHGGDVRGGGGQPWTELQITKGGEASGFRVRAGCDVPQAGGLVIVPLVNHSMRVMATCSQGWAPEVTVSRPGLLSRTMYLCVTSSFPSSRATAPVRSMDEWDAKVAAAVAADGTGAFGDHDWKKTHFPWPFWSARRSELEPGTNCSLQPLPIAAAVTASAKGIIDEAFVDTFEVVLPVIVNTAPLKKGDELLVFWPSRHASNKRQSKLTKITWADQTGKKQRL